ncbi:hypothetical protein I6M53_02200 [Shewanella algae]|nr:hypothetical protein [Shewanella algae]
MSHGFGFNLLAVLTQLHEKWPDSFSAAAFTYPENLMGIRIGHHCGVTMAFEQGKYRSQGKEYGGRVAVTEPETSVGSFRYGVK